MSASTNLLRSVLGNRVVAYHPVFARALGSVPAAVMLSQAYYWQENPKGNDTLEIDGEDYFAKTYEDWYDATGITRNFQQTSRELLRMTGFWLEERRGMPAKMYYRIDFDLLITVMSKYLELGTSVSADVRPQNAQNQRSTTGKFESVSRKKPVDRDTVNKAAPVDRDTVNKLTAPRSTSQPRHGKQVDRDTVNNNKGIEYSKNFEIRVCEESARVEKTAGDSSAKPVGQKIPPSSAPPPHNDTPVRFSESPWAKSSLDEWAESFRAVVDGIPADPAWYLNRVKDWSAEKGGTSLDWVSTAARFAKDDLKKNKLVTTQALTYVLNHNSPANSYTQNTGSDFAPGASTIVSPDEVLARTARIIERRRIAGL